MTTASNIHECFLTFWEHSPSPSSPGWPLGSGMSLYLGSPRNWIKGVVHPGAAGPKDCALQQDWWDKIKQIIAAAKPIHLLISDVFVTRVHEEISTVIWKKNRSNAVGNVRDFTTATAHDNNNEEKQLLRYHIIFKRILESNYNALHAGLNVFYVLQCLQPMH